VHTRPFRPAEEAVIKRYFSFCGCGGRLLDEDDPRAKLRCPECGSDDFEEGERFMLFD
jgi:hypothetical protein